MAALLRRYGKALLITAAAVTVAGFIYISSGLVRDLSAQERQRMEIWADATRELIRLSSTDGGDENGIDIDFLLSIIRRNSTIPVLLTDGEGNILQNRNFSLPEPDAANDGDGGSEANRLFLKEKLRGLSSGPNVIDITLGPETMMNLYYEDSTLLKRLSYYPYVQLLVMIAFILVVYYAVLSTKRPNRTRCGSDCLKKRPISSAHPYRH